MDNRQQCGGRNHTRKDRFQPELKGRLFHGISLPPCGRSGQRRSGRLMQLTEKATPDIATQLQRCGVVPMLYGSFPGSRGENRRTAKNPAKSGECESRDLNPDGFPHWILSPARLPIPPLSRIAAALDRELRLANCCRFLHPRHGAALYQKGRRAARLPADNRQAARRRTLVGCGAKKRNAGMHSLPDLQRQIQAFGFQADGRALANDAKAPHVKTAMGRTARPVGSADAYGGVEPAAAPQYSLLSRCRTRRVVDRRARVIVAA
jgi:hypothetical protein